MTISVEKMRFDMAEQQRKSVWEQRWETRKFVAATIVATAGAIGAGVGIGNLAWAHRQP